MVACYCLCFGGMCFDFVFGGYAIAVLIVLFWTGWLIDLLV